MPIQSFRHKGLKKLFEDDNARGVLSQQVDKIRDMLAAIDAADEVEEIGLFPGWRLHPLKGDYEGFYSITVTGNWRIVFRFEDGDADDLDLIDYH